LSTKQDLDKRTPDDPLLYVVTFGRKTLERHVVKLRFVLWSERENSLCVLSSRQRDTPRLPDWFLNIAAGSGNSYVASNSISGRITRATLLLEGEPSGVEEWKMVYDHFSKKYGGKILSSELGYYAHSRPIILEFEPVPREVIAKTTGKDDIITSLEFDLQAQGYTSLILQNPISRWQREVSLVELAKCFHSGDRILEIGCGTGIETIALATRGVNILATDVSEKMLEILHRRARTAGVDPKVKSRMMASSEIAALQSDSYFPPGGFDGAFSTFGAMNLEKDLKRFSCSLAKILKPKGLVVFGVWNKRCLSDAVASGLLGRTDSIRQRFSGFARAGDESKYSLDTFSYSPKEFYRFFAAKFDLISLVAVPTFIPPAAFSRRWSFLLRFRKADLAVGKLPLFRSVGDNFLMKLQLRG
jgi:SAM-dependent methyltransferase